MPAVLRTLPVVSKIMKKKRHLPPDARRNEASIREERHVSFAL